MGDIYLSDREIAKRLGMSVIEWTATATVLERSGLPRRSPMFQDRRHWIAVQDFLYSRERRNSTPEEKDIETGFKNTRIGEKDKRQRGSAPVLGSQQSRPRPQLRAVINQSVRGD